jgi:hypothetical protein
MTSLGLAARRLGLMAVTCEVVTALEAARVRSLLLKGEATFAALYDAGEARPAADIDLLVPPGSAETVAEALLGSGWALSLPGARERDLAPHATGWYRNRGGQPDHLDLHTSFWGVTAPEGLLWDLWWARRVALRLGPREVPAVGTATTAMVVAVHRVRSAPGKAEEDLRRAVARLDRAVWEDARAQAEALGCVGLMSAGLRTSPEGMRLAEALQLAPPSAADRLADVAKDQMSLAIWRLRGTSLGARLRAVAQEVLCSRGFLEMRHPYASRGGPWVALARVHRCLDLVRRLPHALRASRAAAAQDQTRPT